MIIHHHWQNHLYAVFSSYSWSTWSRVFLNHYHSSLFLKQHQSWFITIAPCDCSSFITLGSGIYWLDGRRAEIHAWLEDRAVGGLRFLFSCLGRSHSEYRFFFLFFWQASYWNHQRLFRWCHFWKIAVPIFSKHQGFFMNHSCVAHPRVMGFRERPQQTKGHDHDRVQD